jgi:hypothetical protein
MTIEIHNPELEVILQQRLAVGNFANVEDMLLQTLRNAPEPAPLAPAPDKRTGQALIDVCAEIRGLLTDEEIDSMFARNRAPSRTAVDLAP